MTTKSRSGAAAEAIEHPVYVRPQVDGITEVHLTHEEGGPTRAQKLSRLEYLARRGVITPRQLTAGQVLAERWAAYFTPAITSAIEDHAPGVIPMDPLARWAKGQTGFVTRRGQLIRRDPPPTFRPKKPSEARFGHDGFSYAKLEALQQWIRIARMIEHLSRFDRKVLIFVAVEGRPLFEAAKMALGSAERAGRATRLLRRAQEALCGALDAIANETEGPERKLA